MSIVHNEYAGQIVLKNGDYEIFDDIGCLMDYLKLNGDGEVGAAYIKNKATNQWMDVYKAIYVYNKNYWTPMNYGVIAFATKDEVQHWMNDEGEGQLLAYHDLLTLNWGFMSDVCKNRAEADSKKSMDATSSFSVYICFRCHYRDSTNGITRY